MRSKVPNVLVLLAVFNGERWLLEQLNSLLNQKFVNVFVLIGDDNSCDGSMNLLRNLNDSRLIFSSDLLKKGGAGANFFSLLGESVRFITDLECDYVAFCDQDDIWFDDKLHLSIQALEKQNAVAYSSSVTAFWPNGRSKVLTQSAKIGEWDFLYEGGGQGCTFVFRSCLVQPFVDSLKNNKIELHYHDWSLYAYVRSLGLLWVFDARSTMKYRQHSANDTGAKYSMSGVLKRLSLIRSGWYGCQRRLILSILKSANSSLFDKYCSLINGMGFFRYSFFLLTSSRRKFSDRFVLFLSHLVGWDV